MSAGPFADWTFEGSWHRYQELALEAFERDRANGASQTLIVAPPGAGKTLIGLEVVRRVGVPALVLCPTQTIQRQCHDKQELFGGPREELRVLTYQALCQADDPDDLLRGLAERRWAQERAEATGEAAAAILTEARAWTGAAATRREQELGRMIAQLKRHAAAGWLQELSADELLSGQSRGRVAELKRAGVATIVLDECHHLASLWGALLAVVLRELAPKQILGLTATNPTELTAEQAALYRQLLNEVDFTVPTPAVVREGHLAPYQELVQLCEPLASERDWLDARHERFQQLLLDLDDPPEELGLFVWLLARLRERRGPDGSQASWAELARRHPRFAEAGLRWLHHSASSRPRAHRAASSSERRSTSTTGSRCSATTPSAACTQLSCGCCRALGATAGRARRPGVHGHATGHPPHRHRGRPGAAQLSVEAAGRLRRPRS